MGKLITGLLGFGVGYTLAYRNNDAFRQAIFHLAIAFLVLIIAAIVYGAWSAFREREAIKKERRQLESAIARQDKEREEWVRRHIHNVKAECAKEKQAIIIERDNLIAKNIRLVGALRSKWGLHLDNIAKTNPGRAKRMKTKMDNNLRGHGHG